MAKPVVRLGAVQVAFAIAIVAVIGRAAQVQLLDGSEFRDRASAQRTERVELPARRGALYDRAGVTLARTQEVFHVEIAPHELRDRSRNTAIIARHLGLRPAALRRALEKGYAYLHGPFQGGQVQPLRSLRGVHLKSELVRFYPHPGLAQPVLGWTAAAGRPASGIERVLDTVLAGTPGSAVVLRDGSGRRFASPARLDAFPIAGRDVYLTIDAGLQEIVEEGLVDAIGQYQAEGGDVVVLNPTNGEVLAVASRTATGGRTANAFTAVFEPGSTAKPFVVAALLAQNRASMTDSIWGEDGSYDLSGRTIRDDHASGWLSLSQVIQRSSNIGIVKFAARLAPIEQYEMLRRFGLGTPTSIDYPSESGGILRHPVEWSGLTPASLAMGYEVAVTPLQLAQAYAAVANDGVLIHPTLLSRVVAPDGDVVYRHRPEPVRRVVTAAVAAQIRGALRSVVAKGGTGETAALTTYDVAGKTGTAYRAGPKGYSPGAYTASFVSMFPADRPQLVMVVKLDNPAGAYASATAAPLTRVLLERVLAAQTGAHWAGASADPAPVEEPSVASVAGDAPRTIVQWPRQQQYDTPSDRLVPDVTGSSLREAARLLHQVGLRMELVGWGPVERTEPTAGSTLPAGAVVRVYARDVGDHRQ